MATLEVRQVWRLKSEIMCRLRIHGEMDYKWGYICRFYWQKDGQKKKKKKALENDVSDSNISRVGGGRDPN